MKIRKIEISFRNTREDLFDGVLHCCMLPFGSLERVSPETIRKYISEPPGSEKIMERASALFAEVMTTECDQTSELTLGMWVAALCTPTSGTSIRAHMSAGSFNAHVEFPGEGSTSRALQILGALEANGLLHGVSSVEDNEEKRYEAEDALAILRGGEAESVVAAPTERHQGANYQGAMPGRWADRRMRDENDR